MTRLSYTPVCRRPRLGTLSAQKRGWAIGVVFGMGGAIRPGVAECRLSSEGITGANGLTVTHG